MLTVSQFADNLRFWSNYEVNQEQALKIARNLSENWEDARRNKIQAIKMIRETSHLGLKEAKDLYESINFGLQPVPDPIEEKESKETDVAVHLIASMMVEIDRLNDQNNQQKREIEQLKAELNTALGERNAYKDICNKLIMHD